VTTLKHDKADIPSIIDVTDQWLVADPFGGYSRIREDAPITRAVGPYGDEIWLVTRYADVKRLMNDSRFSNNTASVSGMVVSDQREKSQATFGLSEEYMKYRMNTIFEYDGPDHTRLRKIVARAFTPRRIGRLRPRAEQITAELLDRLPETAENGVVDLLKNFSYPMTAIVICEIVGVPPEDHILWRDWYDLILAADGRDRVAAWSGTFEYVRNMIERRGAGDAVAHPAGPTGDGDLISVLMEGEEGDQLSKFELMGMVHLLATAGQLTVANLIASGTVALLTHPDQLALLRENPELMPRAVKELLRWCGPVHAPHVRYATEDVELHGVLIRKGEAVLCSLAAANYDPREFDAPERLDITRSELVGPGERHVTFGYGVHHCLGATLAQMEGEVALAALFNRFPGLALAVRPDELRHPPMPYNHWRLTELPIRLG
jgi:cytochrome P450